ncbi:MAG: hypothetical protein QM766_15525 [Burkholderiaceae bacterium]
MIEKAVLAIVGLAAVLYAVRALAPSAWLARGVGRAADSLRMRGWPRAARWVAAYAPSSGGCGGCGTCGDASAGAAAAPAADRHASPDRAPVEKPLTFHRRPPR